MAKVFLDTNCFIDALHRRPEMEILNLLENHIAYISPLSLHIYGYTLKIRIPNTKVIDQKNKFPVIELTEEIIDKALIGPTNDFEDNIQLHSCAEEDCDIFLTEDKALLKMKFFGKAKILSPVEM